MLGPTRLLVATILVSNCVIHALDHGEKGSGSPAELLDDFRNGKDRKLAEEELGKSTSVEYEPTFPAVSRSIIGRQDNDDQTSLENNVPAKAQITPNQVLDFVFPSSVLHGARSTATPIIPPSKKRRELVDASGSHADLRKRQDDVNFYLTLSVCSQPSPANASNTVPPPALKLFLSFTDPNPVDGHPGTIPLDVKDGFMSYENPTSDNVFIQVQAIEASNTAEYTGSYSFELTGSIDIPYAAAKDSSGLYFVDSDSGGAMLITTNLTDPSLDGTSENEEWTKFGAPFTVAVVNQNNTQMAGLMRSYCAFHNNTSIIGNFLGQNSTHVDVGLTSVVGGNATKQQFYVSSLNRSSSYQAIMGLPTNYTTAGSGQPGGGGTIWPPVAFNTQTDENCKVIYNLSFCDRVNYAVPYNPTNLDYQGTDLANWYDNQAKNWWTNFSNAIDQVACNTTPDAQYSLAVTCQDCKNSYRQWLCAVTAPRCRDFSSTASYLMPRAIGYPFFNNTTPSSISSDPIFNNTNQQILAYANSRNPYIDQTIKPGPYKELLPCGAMCFSLVQTCPAALGFACPIDGKAFNYSYGFSQMDGATPQCNIPGQVWGVSAGIYLQPSLMTVTFTTLIISLLLQLGIS